jgi:hypothetical protein
VQGRLEAAERALARRIAEKTHAPRLRTLAQKIGLLPERDHLVCALRAVMTGEVPVLSGKILVDEKQPHQIGSRIARRR